MPTGEGANYDQIFFRTAKRKVVLEVDYHDVDDLINRQFPDMNSEYECVAYEEWNNSEDHDTHVNGKLDEYDVKEIEKVLSTKKWPKYSTSLLLNYLCSKQIIPAGNYLISVFW